MIRIGFDDDDKILDPDQLDEDGNPIEKSGTKVDFEKNKEVYLSPRRLEQLKEELSCVVVHDFGDEYHLSEEERREKNALYDAFKKFRKYKHTYRKLDEYVVVMREALSCLKAVAENNGVYSEDEFIKLFLRKKIEIAGLRLPRYKGRNRKALSWDFVTEFILSNDPPEDILPKPREELITEDEYEEAEQQLFDAGQMDIILRPVTEKEQAKFDEFFDIEEDKQVDNGMAVELSKKDQKALMKAQPELMYTIKEGRRNMKSIANLDRLAYTLTDDDLDMIELNDKKYQYVSSSDYPVFEGDLNSGKNYHKYIMKLQEYENTQIKENYSGRLKTKEEIYELELKQELEANGWNLRNLYENKDKEKRLKKAQKRDKKQEKKIKEKLLAVQNRRKRRMGEDVDNEAYKKGKKKKKGKGKNKDRDKADIKKAKKLKKLKKQKEKDVENFMNNAAILRSDSDSFDEYEKDVLDWSFDNVFKE
jgi:hypothetical protein